MCYIASTNILFSNLMMEIYSYKLLTCILRLFFQSVLDFKDIPVNDTYGVSTPGVNNNIGVIHPLKQSPSGDSRSLYFHLNICN